MIHLLKVYLYQNFMNFQYLPIAYKEHSVEIPYVVFQWKKPGPNIFISGWMHGNEIWWIAVVEAFLEWAKKNNIEEKLCGSITVIPLLNPSGFNTMRRRVAEDHKDLNRSFWVEEITTFSEKIAFELEKNLLSKTQYGIDFHDAWSWSILMPHSRVHKTWDSDETKQMWQLFGTRVVIARKGNKHMMSVALLKKYGIKVLTLELWWAHRIFDEYVDIGLTWIRNFLAYHKMYPSKILLPENQYLLTGRYGISLHESALVSFQVKIGDFVHYGQHIWEVYYPYSQKHEKIIAPMCGYIFSLTLRNQVPIKSHKKTWIIYSILETKDCHIERTTTNKFKELKNIHIDEIVM
jgi:predicted deacylase